MFVLVYIDSRFLYYATCRKMKISTIARYQKVSSLSQNFVISPPPPKGGKKKKTKNWRQISSNFEMFKSI